MVFHWVGVVLFVDLQNDLRPCATHKSTVQFYDVGTGLSELNHLWLLPLLCMESTSGADPGFFLGGGALVSCSTSTPINHIFFLQNTSCIRKPQVISGGGGVRTPCTLPLDPPLHFIERTPLSRTRVLSSFKKQNGYQYLKYCLCPVPISSQHHWKSYWCLLISREIPLQSWNI